MRCLRKTRRGSKSCIWRDGSLFEQLQALEEELIERLCKGDLSGPDRHRFERHYLASEQRRARIETARQLVRVCSLNSPTQAVADDRGGSRFFLYARSSGGL